MRFLVFIIMAIGNSLFIIANEAKSSLSIYVFDENSNPLSGATVTIENSSNNKSFKTSSNNKGLVYFEKIDSGAYNLHVSYIGYEDFTKYLDLSLMKVYDNEKIMMSIESIEIEELEIINEINNKAMVGTITSINSKALEEIIPIGTQEILDYVPGINGFSDDGIGNSRINIGIRGINPRRSSRVLILEDGIPIQPALYVYPNMYYNPPAERLSEVEVIKGSGSILFGPQTMGGIINYLTKKPSPNSKPKIKLMVGENNYKSIFFETGGFNRMKSNPEFQILLKQGDGFRDNNDFEQINATLKFNYNKSKDESLYSKTNVNYENSNATYTGLTLYSFQEDPNFNPKEYDNFNIFRVSSDLIHTKRISQNTKSTTTTFLSFFDRKWWRENDVFIKASDISLAEPTPINPTSPLNKIRVGDGESNLGILRTFYVAGIEKKFLIDNQFFKFPNTFEIGGRAYFERFIDDKNKGYAPDARDGYYFINEEEYIDADDSGYYDEGEDFTDCNEEQSVCESDSEWEPEMGNGQWDGVNIVGQSHHYETTAFSGFISQSIKLNSENLRELIINPGLRLEIFEQERIDLLNGAQYLDKTTFVVLPGIGFNKKINNINIFGGIHRGFTPPSSGALNILNFGECDCESGLDLDAEKSWNKELGFRYNTSMLNMEVAAFHIDIENLVAAARGTSFKNLGKVQTMGIEFGSALYLSDIYTLLPNIHISYGYLYSEVIEGIIKTSFLGIDENDADVSIAGNELPYAPNHKLVFSIENDFFDKLSLRGDLKYVSSTYSDFENFENDDSNTGYSLGISGPIPEHAILNFSSSYQVNEKLKFYLIIKNVTDEIYNGSRLHSNPGQTAANMSSGILPGPRRQINFGMNYIF